MGEREVDVDESGIEGRSGHIPNAGVGWRLDVGADRFDDTVVDDDDEVQICNAGFWNDCRAGEIVFSVRDRFVSRWKKWHREKGA